MALEAIGAVAMPGYPVPGIGTAPTGALSPTGAAPTEALQGVAGSDPAQFAQLLTRGVERLEGLHSTAEGAAAATATGELRDVHDYMIASTEAKLATDLTVAVRNKAVEAFNDVMRMPI